tara:strand:+ start:117 stop:260 length:144 start_codon:yes stop_codon:yes gene_type:complete
MEKRTKTEQILMYPGKQLKIEKKDKLDIKRNKIRNELKKIKNNKYKK